MSNYRKEKAAFLAMKTATLSANVSAKQFDYSDLGDSPSLPLAVGSHTAELKLTTNGKLQLWLNGVMKEEWT